MLYNNLSGYFRKKYGKRLGKICIDGGFSCPNRDGTCGTGGCIYCGERGAGEHIFTKDTESIAKSISEQVARGLAGAKEDDLFVAYFQNFTNTYAPIATLKERYDAALIDSRIAALAIGTRPDCISEEVAKLIAGYKDKCDVWVELGLQTANDETARLINRGYGKERFKEAMEILSRYGISVCVHLIIGLPGEDDDDIRRTVEYLADFSIWGIKIHSIYVMEGTRLAEMHRENLYTPPTLEDYIRRAVYIITHISGDIIIHRLTGDCPENMLIAPDWNRNKHALIERIQHELSASGLYQGIYYNCRHI